MTERALGAPVSFSGARPPVRRSIEGAYACLEPLDVRRHGDALWAGACEAEAAATWDYLPYGPFATRADFEANLERRSAGDDPLLFAIVDQASGLGRGVVAFMRITPDMGVIEIGHVWFAPSLQRTRPATEAIYLMMREAFDGLGNRRLEWKCNALNVASRRAAERFGFAFEGIFRQHMVWKGRNRDTAWYAMIDADWPAARQRFEIWLDPANFTPDGRQRRPLNQPPA